MASPLERKNSEKQNIIDQMRHIIADDQVVEIRVMGAAGNGRRTDSGYFDNLGAFAQVARGYSNTCPAVYFTLNPLNPALLARSENEMTHWARSTTQDADIIKRRWFVIDIDAQRPSGISSSETEHAAALEQARAISAHLSRLGWPVPIRADSGNGAHLLYRVDLPNDAETAAMLSNCLGSLQQTFLSATTDVDQTVFNAARIWKIYGTMACKGSDTDDRPHRMASIISVPDEIEIVSLDKLQKLAASLVVEETSEPKRTPYKGKATSFDIDDFISKHGLDVRDSKPYDGGRKWIFNICPWNAEHTDSSAFIIQGSDGRLGAGCHHNGCSGKDWRELREIYDPVAERRRQTLTRDEKESIVGRISKDIENASGVKEIKAVLLPKIDELSELDDASIQKIATVAIENGLTERWLKDNFISQVRKVRKANEREAAAARAEAEEERLRDIGLPLIVTNGRQLRDVTSDATEALVKANQLSPTSPVLFVRSGKLVRVTQDETGGHKIEEYTKDSMEYILSQIATWTIEKESENGTKMISTNPSLRAVSSLLAMPEWKQFPSLAGLTHCPIFTENGLHSAHGYDEGSRLFNTYADKVELTMSLDEAKEVLRKLFSGFPFDSEASRCHAYCLLLQPFVRSLINGSTPIYDIEAPLQGTGKTLLATIASYPSRGSMVPANTSPSDDDEWRKKLLSVFYAADTHLLIDNVNDKLDAPSLASAVTSDTFSDRALGKNEMVSYPVTQTFIITANNFTPSAELGRRCIRIRINAQVERPELRDDFEIPDIENYVQENRVALVEACLVLIQNWWDQGRPDGVGKKGSFESWVKVMGGIMEANDIGGFLLNENEMRETAQTESQLITALVQRWLELYGTEKVTLADIFKLASTPDRAEDEDGEWEGILDEILKGRDERSRRQNLGYILKNSKEVPFLDHSIIKEKGRTAAYRLEKIYKTRKDIV